MAGSGQVSTILPGHGPTLPDAAGVVRYYLQHRGERLEQVRAAVAEVGPDADAVVRRVYADVATRGVAGRPAQRPCPARAPAHPPLRGAAAARRTGGAVSGRGA